MFEESQILKTSLNSHNSSLDKLEETRKLNSKRQFQIKNSNSRSKNKKRLKSPSDLTAVGGKSVVSLFSNQSGKTNHSAPLGNSTALAESPHYRSKLKAVKEVKLKKKTRPASSLSPSQNAKGVKAKEKFNLTSVNFNQSLNFDQRGSSTKVLSLKNIKFPQKKQQQQQTGSLPKPPLHKKNIEATTETFGTGSTAEALLKMADERLATIE